MIPKKAWVIVAVLVLALGASLVIVRNERTRRVQAAKELAAAQKAKQEADEAVAKALAARAEAETAKKQQDAELKALRADLNVRTDQAAEWSTQKPLMEAEVSAVRKTLAELQRLLPADTPKAEPRKPAAIPARRKEGWSVPELLPPETLGLITLRDVPVLSAKLKETGLWKILSSPEIENVFVVPLGRARSVILMGEVMLGEKLSDLTAFLSQGEITFAVLGLDKRMGNGAPLPDVMLSIQLRDKAPAFMEEFNTRLDQLKAATNGMLESSQSKLGNTTITRLRHPKSPGDLSCCLCDGTFLMCLGEGRIEKLLTMREKMKSAAEKNDGAKADVLAQLPAYKKAVEKAGPDADSLVWVNIDAITSNPMLNNRELTPTQRRDLDISGLTDIKAASYSFSVRDKGIYESIFLDVPAQARKGALGLIEGENADLKALYDAPRNSLLAWTFKVSPEKLFDKLVALAAAENPAARNDIAEKLFMLGESLKIDVKKDLLGALTGQGLFSLSVPSRNSKLTLAFPQPVLALRVQNSDSLKRVLAALLAATPTQEKFEISDVAEGASSIKILRERDLPAGQVHQLCFTQDQNDLLLSFYPLALREELQRRAAKGTRLEDDPGFSLARANLPGQPQAMLYADMGALMTAAYDVIMPIVQFQQRAPQVDLNALPTGDILSRNLGSALFELSFAADGIQIEGYSPGGMVVLALPAAAAVAGRRAGQMRVDLEAGIAIDDGRPARAARPGRVEPQKLEMLEKLARDLKEYVKEHGGEYPSRLTDMQPKYLQDLGNALENIVYLGKQPEENRVVAHSSEKMPGDHAVLLQNGMVQGVMRSRLPKALKDGVASDQPAAVKPPKPPNF